MSDNNDSGKSWGADFIQSVAEAQERANAEEIDAKRVDTVIEQRRKTLSLYARIVELEVALNETNRKLDNLAQFVREQYRDAQQITGASGRPIFVAHEG